MDSPLNQAHLEARKAERSEKIQQWDEAIASHSKAAELLLEAEKLTSDPRVLESLRLQHEAHQRQRLLLKHRRDLSQFIYRYKISMVGVESTTLTPVDTVQSELRLSTSDNREHSHYVNVSDLQEEDSVYKTLAECDSLLHILNKRGRPCGNTCAVRAERNISAAKLDKDQCQIMEELKVQNDELRVHVLGLLQEADSQRSQIFSLHRENEELKQRIYGLLGNTVDTGGVTDIVNNTSPSNKLSQEPSDLSSDTVNTKAKVITEVKGEAVEGHTEDRDTEEEEEPDLFLNTNLEFPPLELPPLEIPEYHYENSEDS